MKLNSLKYLNYSVMVLSEDHSIVSFVDKNKVTFKNISQLFCSQTIDYFKLKSHLITTMDSLIINDQPHDQKLIITILDYRFIVNFDLSSQIQLISYINKNHPGVFFLYNTLNQPEQFFDLCINTGLRSDNILKPSDKLTEFNWKVLNNIQWLGVIDNLHKAENNVRHFHQLSTVDELTGLYNMRHFKDCLIHQCSVALKNTTSLAVIMLDVDYFKSVNDYISHLAGSKVLATIGKIIAANLRQLDIAARYGGDEFVIILNQTRPNGAKAVCKRLMEKISEHNFIFDDQKLQVSLSAGLSYFASSSKHTMDSNHQQTPSKNYKNFHSHEFDDLSARINLDQDSNVESLALDLIKQADHNLYLAKQQGRACVNFNGEFIWPSTNLGTPISITNIDIIEEN